jgi:acetylornithine deacetylase/succinyl-diaminopimelate desuccinylase family protein
MTVRDKLGMRTELISSVQGYRDAMVEWTEQLVAIPTENPPGACYPQAVELIRSHLEKLGFHDTHLEGDCVLSFIGEGEPTFYFSGHYDVVPAQDPVQFEPARKGVNLFARGSSDMKSGLAAMTYAAKAVRDSVARLNGRIGLVFVPDEETAGPRGSRFLAEKGLLGRGAIGMLTPEPTGGVVWNANRGAITLNVRITGKSAHVGRQREGVNAFEQMIEVAPELSKLKEEVEQRSTGYEISPESVRRSILMMGGRCESGSNFNVVPDRCSFTIDRRINPEEDFQTEKQRLLGTLEKAREKGIDLEVEILQEGSSCGVSKDGLLGKALAQSIREVTGREAQFEMCPGLLEIRFYAERGIPAFAYGPGLLTVSHGPNEFVPIDRIVQCATIYALTVTELLSWEMKL